MSKNQSENRSPQSLPAVPAKVNRASELVIEDVPRQMTMGSIVSESGVSESGLAEPNKEEPDDAWDVVDLPGTVGEPKLASSNSPLAVIREKELLTLIRDLNECNDVLLTKISRLETALGESQQSVRAEVDRAKAAEEKRVEQLSAQQATAQQTAQTAQQQVAQLVGQLDTAEQTIQRQQLIHETLQAEFNEAQDRITQLERECALTTQQHADEAQARIKAETTNRDLRSRLQRQQRYTLQFKAALEKSLTVNARPASRVTSVVQDPFSFNEPDSLDRVTMPRAERIAPWNAIGSAPFAGIDPHLENLIRGQADTDTHPDSSYTDSRLESSPSGILDPSNRGPVVDSEAEAKLWQDLERIMGAAPEPADSRAVDPSVVEVEAAPPTEVAAGTEIVDESISAQPRLNWQAKSALPVDPTTASASVTPASATPLPAVNLPTTAQIEPTQAEPTQTEQAESKQAKTKEQTERYLPSLESETSAVSPVVNPLRTQRRIGSMAAVQLPTFEKAKAGSFKR